MTTYDFIKSYPQDEKAVLVGIGGLIDGYHVVDNRDLRAVWNASSFAIFDNGTISAAMTMKYLSANPNSSIIYNSTTGRNYSVAVGGDLEYLTSIVLVHVLAEYHDQQLGSGTSPSLSDVIALQTDTIDNQTSTVSFKARYNTSAEYPLPIPPTYELRSYWVQLSWVRVFQDNDGNKYYQWLTGSSPYACGSSAQCVKLNQEYHSLSGSFDVYMPIPGEATTPLPESATGRHKVEFDYVRWISEMSILDGNIQSDTGLRTVDNYWVMGTFWIVGIAVAIITGTIGGIISFRRWKRK